MYKADFYKWGDESPGEVVLSKWNTQQMIFLLIESNERQPRGREEKEKLKHIQIILLDSYSFLSFFLSFQTNVSEDSSLHFQGFKGSVKETNKTLPFSLFHSV